MKLSYYLDKISNMVDWLILRIVFIGIVGMIISISLQIIFRVFFNALVWTEEAARYLLVWSSFLGATLAYKRKMHIAVTAGVELMPKALRIVIALLSIGLSLIFFSICAYYGFQLMAIQAYQLSPALRIPMKYIYMGIPLSFIIMIIHGLNLMVQEVLKHKEARV